MSAVGNDRLTTPQASWPCRLQTGLTLIELMVVTLLIAVAVGGVSLSLRDQNATALDREAQRVVSVLEATRAQVRGSGVAMLWVALPQGFAIQAVPYAGGRVEVPLSSVTPWLNAQTQVQVSGGAGQNQTALLLAAEPMMAPATVVLSSGERQLRLVTDGLRPFRIEAALPGSQERQP